MNNDDLQKIRADIVARAQALALNGDVNESDKLSVLMNIIQSGSITNDVIKATLDTIERLSDDNSKLENYLDLLYEVDQLIAKNNTPSKMETDNQAEQNTDNNAPTETDNDQE